MVKKTKLIKKNDKLKVKSKRILKSNQATLTIKEHKPAEYVNRFFKDKEEDAEMQYFFR